MQRQILNLLVIFSIVGLATSGCGPSGPHEAKVTGSVTMGGKAEESVRVNFIHSGNKDASKGAVTKADGKFEVELQPGKYAVTLSKMVDKTGKVPGESEDPTKDYTQLEASGLLRQAIPRKYVDPSSTPLSAEITEEEQDMPPFDVVK